MTVHDTIELIVSQLESGGNDKSCKKNYGIRMLLLSPIRSNDFVRAFLIRSCPRLPFFLLLNLIVIMNSLSSGSQDHSWNVISFEADSSGFLLDSVGEGVDDEIVASDLLVVYC